MNASEKDKLIRIIRKLEQRVDANRREGLKHKSSPENAQYHYGARDEAEKILKWFQVEFNDELRIVNVITTGEVL